MGRTTNEVQHSGPWGGQEPGWCGEEVQRGQNWMRGGYCELRWKRPRGAEPCTVLWALLNTLALLLDGFQARDDILGPWWVSSQGWHSRALELLVSPPHLGGLHLWTQPTADQKSLGKISRKVIPKQYNNNLHSIYIVLGGITNPGMIKYVGRCA